MKIEVYKDTTDDWHESYKLEKSYQKLVRVTLMKVYGIVTENKAYKVCVWGSGELGMERFFETPDDAIEAFRIITGLTSVTFSALRKLGLTTAK